MNETEVRTLLGRAADEAGRPAVTTDAVYTKASHIRWRRRAVVSGAALAVVAAGLAIVPGTVGQESGEASVAAPTELTGGSGQAKKLAKLLPPEVGKIEQVSWAVLLKQADAKHAEGRHVGPLDGEYAVRRDGGVGYLHIRIMTHEYIDAKTGGKGMPSDLCGPDGGRIDCVREQLPDGRVLTIWREDATARPGRVSPSTSPGGVSPTVSPVATGYPTWGPELVGRLTLPDGRILAVRDSSGFQGKNKLGPLLKTTPLGREQLRDLMLRPELLPKR
ncbi:hypothetical protein [Streptomyces chromofuscus]|uniref:Uncharacterized protein n=1 Tax=Streptomyces chromofuscus TaxID=42881 RepID=A0A7M2SZH7_STRCW|nr:hypothetical protein [Streptomyces chromofuscus]QOV41722.1 hypothetical protein IPT68_17480 [Streptomyces chromofuscus]